ncbi:MAG: hypothetical protein PHT40_01045 [Patescibacteria group bacterium]|nr:hypothetical protein [Patescibacteria group bacterium]
MERRKFFRRLGHGSARPTKCRVFSKAAIGEELMINSWVEDMFCGVEEKVDKK